MVDFKSLPIDYGNFYILGKKNFLSQNRSRHIDEFKGKRFDLVITLCGGAAETCPFAPDQGPRVHIGFDDPAVVPDGEDVRLDAFRKVRDEMLDVLVPFVRDKLVL